MKDLESLQTAEQSLMDLQERWVSLKSYVSLTIYVGKYSLWKYNMGIGSHFYLVVIHISKGLPLHFVFLEKLYCSS